MSLFSELKRRRVIGAAVSYVVLAWLLLQVADTILGIFEAPDWAIKLVPVLLLLGFPVALTVAWFFQLRFLVEREPDPPTDPASAIDAMAEPALATSVAVLPFTNVSDDAQGEYFADGLWLELLHTLVRIPDLHVPGRSSCARFRGHSRSAAEIGRELNVRHLLEGSVRKAGQDVRISVQLVNAESGFHLWSETFDRQLSNFLQLQDEIAATVAGKLQVELLGSTPATPVPERAENPEALNAYLRGRFFWSKRTREDYMRANLAYQEALMLDPGMEAAHAGIAEVNTALAIEGEDTAWYRRAREAAATVLRLDAKNVDGHVCHARLEMYCDWDWATAQRHIDIALELNPSNPSAQAVHARFLTFTGRLEDALAAQRKALSLDPLSLIHNRLFALLLYFTGRYSEALIAIRKTIELDASFQSSHFNLGCIQLAQQHPDLALAAFRAEPHQPLSLTGRTIAHGALGQHEQAQSALDELLREHSKGWGYQIGLVYAHRNEPDLALEWLHRATAERDAGVLSAGVDPLLKSLHGDPRFGDVLKDIGLLPYFAPGATHRPA